MKKILKKLKGSWRENRVLFVLTSILIICVILIIIICVDYFLGASKDKYGDRLEGIKKVEINNKRIKTLEDKISEDEKITSCKINQIGKMIYIDIKFGSEISLEEAKEKVSTTIELFSEKELKFYDINYTIEQTAEGENPGFIIMGSRNANGSGLMWNNNTPIIEEEE